MAKKKAETNYLDQIPLKNPAYVWGTHEETGLVTVTVPHTGFFDKVAQQVFHKPAHSRIDLDTYGSFIWKQIDGETNIYQVATAVKAQFGEDAEPLYNRIVAFFEILKEHKFITLRKPAPPAP